MRSVAVGLLGLLVAGSASAQTALSSAAFTAGRQQLAAGDYLEAADSFHRALRAEGVGRFTLRVAVFCDLTNLERVIRESAGAAELLVLRRSVGDRPCMALYWGLFPSRDAARAAVGTIPTALRAPGQAPVPVAEILPPVEAPPAPVAAARPPAPRPQPTVPPPAVAPPVTPPPAAVAPARPPVAAAPLVPAPPAPAVEPPPPAVEPAPAPVEPTPSQPLESVRVPAVEIEAGYSVLWDDQLSLDGGNAFFDLGWVLSGTANLNRKLGVVGEVSGHYDSGQTFEFENVPLGLDLDVMGVHAGLRYSHRGGGPAVPYLQALAGWTRTGAEIAGVREVEDAFSIQPGAGLQLRLTPSLGLALGADYRLVFSEEESRNELRLHAGLVFAVGNR